MNKKFHFFIALKAFSNKGQTAVEYVLLFAVVIVMTLALMKQIKDRMVGDISNCTANSKDLGCKLRGAFPTGGYENFRYFKVM
ncbi:MAG: class III signal peptide-containing protein [Bacteriovoracaceae bacterium]|jgi:hypothetical protein|nr:class III signal peptide-containing protein [Bacteriovoracaceae bacterium]